MDKLVSLLEDPLPHLEEIIGLSERLVTQIAVSPPGTWKDQEVSAVSALLLGYFVELRLDEARFLWKRIPNTWHANALLQSIWEIGQHLILRNFPHLLRASRWFVSRVSDQSLHDQSLHALALLVDDTCRALAHRQLLAFHNISIQTAQDFLAANDAAEAVKQCQDRGWQLDSDGLFLVHPSQ